MNDFVVNSLQNLDTLPNATKEFKSYHLSAQGDSLISVTSEPYYGLAHHRAFMYLNGRISHYREIGCLGFNSFKGDFFFSFHARV